MFENFDDILTVEEACEALKIGYNAMYELLNTGKLKGYRNGRVWRFRGPRWWSTSGIVQINKSERQALQ